MRKFHGRVLTAALVTALAGCAPTTSGEKAGGGAEPSGPSRGPTSSSSFPTAAFADISEEPVSEEVAAKLHAKLRSIFEFQKSLKGNPRGGMSATVMSADGTWSGAVGKADGVRDVGANDQFAIGSVTKSIIAAQLMKLVEAGELKLDDPATDHLPKDLTFDTNQATIRHLLGMHSGIPDYWSVLEASLATDRKRVWTTADMLKLVPAARVPAGKTFDYSNTNYLLLELVIEQLRGSKVVDVLRNGVLRRDGRDRLIYQPDERPTEPMAMPHGESTAALKKGAGYLPSIASATAGPTTGAMATDSPSLARWWRAFCAGEIVSRASLTEMSTFVGGYGLGLYNPAEPYAQAFGHTGTDVGYVAWAGCVPEFGSVVVVLTNREVDNISTMPGLLVLASRPG